MAYVSFYCIVPIILTVLSFMLESVVVLTLFHDLLTLVVTSVSIFLLSVDEWIDYVNLWLLTLDWWAALICIFAYREKTTRVVPAEVDPLPGIDGLQISGEAFPGRELQAFGYSINGTTSCNFEWVRYLEDSSVKYIEEHDLDLVQRGDGHKMEQ